MLSKLGLTVEEEIQVLRDLEKIKRNWKPVLLILVIGLVEFYGLCFLAALLGD